MGSQRVGRDCQFPFRLRALSRFTSLCNSPPPISWVLHRPKGKLCLQETPAPHSPSPLPRAPGIHRGTFWLYEIGYSRYVVVQMESNSACLHQLYPGGFPGGASGKEPDCQRRKHTRRGFNPWVGKSRWRSTWQTTPEFLAWRISGIDRQTLSHWATREAWPGEFLMGRGARVAKSQTRLKWLSMHVHIGTHF